MTELMTKPSKNGEEPMEVRRVCFVCTGNTCRSPMAEAVANALAREPMEAMPASVRDCATPTVEAFSAGLYAFAGDPIAENAVLALKAAGIKPTEGHDYRTHTAHTLTAEEVERYDLLVAMGDSHAMELLMRFPQAAQKIVRMPQAISDPYGGNLACYKACLDEIVKGVRTLLFLEETV